MCAIAGYVGPDAPFELQNVKAMIQSMAHRGPDGSAVRLIAGDAVFGHARLSIIDLHSRSNQPMHLPDAGLSIIFNGEIYNYLELRDVLRADGIRFETESDTEVMLRAFEKWGLDCFARFNGMFAAAIWEHRSKKLVLARDRYGKKPLYYRLKDGAITFASELSALRILPDKDDRVSPSALDCYLALGYIPAPLSILSNYSKIRPGSIGLFSDGRYSEYRFVGIERQAPNTTVSEAARLDELGARLREAVKIRFRSDVDVGLFLSGGIDSSSIALSAVQIGRRPKTLTVSFDPESADTRAASELARMLDLPLEIVELFALQIESLVERSAASFSEPFADSSSVPTYALAEACQGRFRVILCGDGGDESLAGYPNYFLLGSKQRIKRLGAALGILEGGRSWQGTYVLSKALCNAGLRQDLTGRKGGSGTAEFLQDEPRLSERPYPDPLRSAMWIDRNLYLADDLLVKMDTTLMHQSIEGRSPLLDPNLVEWSQGLPAGDLISGRFGKVLLRKLLAVHLSPSIAWRKKQGFGSPIEKWLTGPLREMASDMLPARTLRSEPQKQILAEFIRNPGPKLASQVWLLLNLALWERRTA